MVNDLKRGYREPQKKMTKKKKKDNVNLLNASNKVRSKRMVK